MTDINEMADYLRRMGEPPSSVERLLSQRDEAASVTEPWQGMDGVMKSLDTYFKPRKYHGPAVDTGD